MKNLSGTVIWPLLVTIIGGLFLWQLSVYFQPRPRIVFSLPQPIEYRQQVGASRTNLRVQQLEVTNAGSASARNIVIKFSRPITAPDIRKYSKGDRSEIFLQEQPQEIRYPELPPRTNFKVVFSAPQGALQSSDVTVTHSDGKGEEATIAAQTDPAPPLLKFIYWITYSFIIVGGLRTLSSLFYDIKIRNFTWNLHYADKYQTILSNFQRKPWYITQNRWSDIWRAVVIENLENSPLKYDDVEGIENSTVYSLLNKDRPDFVNVTTWNETVKIAQKNLGGQLKNLISFSYRYTDLLPFFDLVQPRKYPEEDWNSWRKSLCRAVSQFFLDATFYDKKAAYKTLKTSKPAQLPEEVWHKIQAEAKKHYLNQIESAIRLNEDALEALSQFELDVFTPEKEQALREFAKNRKAGRLEDQLRASSHPLEELSQFNIEGLNEEQQRRLAMQAYERQKELCLPALSAEAQVRQFVSTGKPEWLHDEDFAQFQQVAQHYDQMRLLLENERTALENTRIEMREAKEQFDRRVNAMRQLALTGTLSEDYEDNFDLEAWQNLQLIAQRLSPVGPSNEQVARLD